MILAVVVLLIVCVHGLMMLERNGAFLSKIHLIDTLASIMFSTEPSGCELYAASLQVFEAMVTFEIPWGKEGVILLI